MSRFSRTPPAENFLNEIEVISVHSPEGHSEHNRTELEKQLAHCVVGLVATIGHTVPILSNRNVGAELRTELGSSTIVQHYEDHLEGFPRKRFDTYEELERAKLMLDGKGLECLGIVSYAPHAPRIRAQAKIVGITKLITPPTLPSTLSKDASHPLLRSRFGWVLHEFNERGQLRSLGRL